MRKLPADIIKLLEEIPHKDMRRKFIAGQINWRLDRGRTFTAKEIAKSAKFRTSAAFVKTIADSMILLGYIRQLPDGSYGPTVRHKHGCDAMVLNYGLKKRTFKRKDIYLGIPVSLPENEIDRILRRLVKSGAIVKISSGVYGLPQMMEQRLKLVA